MTSDISLAFAHPEERAAASASADPRDRISLRDHVVEVEIGAFQQERGNRQRVRFNVVVEVRPHPAPPTWAHCSKPNWNNNNAAKHCRRSYASAMLLPILIKIEASSGSIER